MPQFEDEIIYVLVYLQNAFGNRLSDEQVDTYVNALGSVNIIKLQAAAEKIVRTSLYFPRVAEILKNVNLIPEQIRPGLMLDHQRKAKILKDRFYRTREIDRSGFDALYQELREAGYWAKAEYIRDVERRFEKQLKGESQKAQGENDNGIYKSPEDLRKLYSEFVK